MAITIGTAPDSWGVWFSHDVRQPPWERFLDEAAAAGYAWIELGPYGYMPTDPQKLRAALDQRGLQVCASAVQGALDDRSVWPGLEEQALRVGTLLAALGARFLVLIDDMYTDLLTGRRKAPQRLGTDAWMRLIEGTHRVADIARDHCGLTLAFHPHAETHVEHEDQIEAFLEQTDPARVALCFDVGHHAYCGGDPIRFMRRHHQRIPYLHLKSVDQGVRQRATAEGLPFATAVAMDVFCEPSRGAVDFPAFRDLLHKIGYDGWAIVEQDMYPAPLDKPLPIAKRTRAYLQEIGLG